MTWNVCYPTKGTRVVYVGVREISSGNFNSLFKLRFKHKEFSGQFRVRMSQSFLSLHSPPKTN